jgi:hypothetical protein
MVCAPGAPTPDSLTSALQHALHRARRPRPVHRFSDGVVVAAQRLITGDSSNAVWQARSFGRRHGPVM